MEIQGSEVVLSAHDVSLAQSGARAVNEPGFVRYVDLLYEKIESMIPFHADEQDVSTELEDRTGILRVPYSKRVVVCLGQAIEEGKRLTVRNKEADTTAITYLQQNYSRICASNIARYTAQARARRKLNFTVIRGGKSN